MENNFMICWEANGQKQWEIISGEDATQQEVDRICTENNFDSDDIFVFSMNDEVDAKSIPSIVVETPLGTLVANECGDPGYPGIAVHMIRNGHPESNKELMSVTEYDTYKHDFNTIAYVNEQDEPAAVTDYQMSHQWVRTDDDSIQFARNDGYGRFSLIEMARAGDEQYEVYTDQICLGDYHNGDMAKELDDIVKGFGYASVVAVSKEYGSAAHQILAECIFEHYGSFQAESLFTGNKEDAIAFINNYIEKNGGKAI